MFDAKAMRARMACKVTLRIPTWLLLAVLPACGGGNLASQMIDSPDLDIEGQSKCKVSKSQQRPLIVEWPSADRAGLEAQVTKGLVVVKYQGCEMEVLRRCSASDTKYSYIPITRKRDRVTMRDADDLYANIPLGAAQLEGKLERAGELTVTMTMVGNWEAPQAEVRHDQLSGECRGATHIVTALTAGAFSFFAGGEAEVGGSVDSTIGGGSANSSASKEVLNEDGDEQACEVSTSEDKSPPDNCGALLRLEVAPLLAAAPAPSAVPAPGGPTAGGPAPGPAPGGGPAPSPTPLPAQGERPKPPPPGPGIAVINQSGKEIDRVEYMNCNKMRFSALKSSYIQNGGGYRTPRVKGCVWLKAVFVGGGSTKMRFDNGRGDFIVK